MEGPRLMGLKSRRKGVRGELEACEVLRPLFPNVRRKAFQARGGNEGADLENTPGYHVEVGIGNVNPATKAEQAFRDCNDIELTPIALTRRDRSRWFVTMSVEEFIKLAQPLTALFTQVYINSLDAAPEPTPEQLQRWKELREKSQTVSKVEADAPQRPPHPRERGIKCNCPRREEGPYRGMLIAIMGDCPYHHPRDGWRFCQLDHAPSTEEGGGHWHFGPHTSQTVAERKDGAR